MVILNEKISRVQLKELAANTFVDMIKCVADVKLGLLAVDAELHADQLFPNLLNSHAA